MSNQNENPEPTPVDPPAPRWFQCVKCQAPMNEGEGKTFTVCEDCWNAQYRPPAPAGAPAARLQQLRELIGEALIAANSLHDVVMVGWAPAVDPQRWALQVETHLREVLEQMTALLADPAGWDVHGYESKQQKGDTRVASVPEPPALGSIASTTELASAPVENAQGQHDDPSRCAICGWSLVAELARGCIRGNCSMRPFPTWFYAPVRAAIEYGQDLTQFDRRAIMPKPIAE